MSLIWITKSGSGAGSGNLPILAGTVCCSPLLRPVPPAQCPAPPALNESIIFTSRNGVDAFCSFTNLRNWPVYVVGDATQERAQSHGFESVISAGKNADALAALICRQEPVSQPLYYARGAKISTDLAGTLSSAGFSVRQAVVYETLFATVLPAAVRAGMARKERLSVMMYSPQAAKAFRHLLKCNPASLHNISTVSISAAVDAALGDMPLARRLIADHPDERSMLARLSDLVSLEGPGLDA